LRRDGGNKRGKCRKCSVCTHWEETRPRCTGRRNVKRAPSKSTPTAPCSDCACCWSLCEAAPRPGPTASKRRHTPSATAAPGAACLEIASAGLSLSAARACTSLSVDFCAWFLAVAADARGAASPPLARGWAERDSSRRQAREARESMYSIGCPVQCESSGQLVL